MSIFIQRSRVPKGINGVVATDKAPSGQHTLNPESYGG